MRKLSAALIALTAAASPALAQQPAQPGEQLWDRVVAVVGDTTLLYSDVLLELEALQARGQQIPTDPAGREQVFREVLNSRVDDLLLLEAARASGVSIDIANVVSAAEQRLTEVQSQFASQAEFEAALAQSGRTLEQYRQTVQQQFIDQTMVRRYAETRMQKMARPRVTDAEIRAFFDQQAGRLGNRPANLSFQQAVIRPAPSDSAKAAARRRAEEILAEIRAGGDFEALARRHSADPSAAQGGMLGWFREGQMVRPFEAMAYALRPGAVSPVVETEYGFHIIKLERIRGPERQARHILIRPEVTPADVERARASADSVAAAARAGASLTQLADQYGTPADQRINRDVPVDQLPPAYATVLGTAEVNAVVGPFVLEQPTGQSFVVAKVIERQAAGAYELSDVEEQVRQRVQEQKMMQELVEDLRRSMHVAILL